MPRNEFDPRLTEEDLLDLVQKVKDGDMTVNDARRAQGITTSSTAKEDDGDQDQEGDAQSGAPGTTNPADRRRGPSSGTTEGHIAEINAKREALKRAWEDPDHVWEL